MISAGKTVRERILWTTSAGFRAVIPSFSAARRTSSKLKSIATQPSLYFSWKIALRIGT
jgi:hypothetical protein